MLRRLIARNFRNLEPLTWQPAAGSHLLLGDNGAGKTSLLEAIYTLATTRSFRTPRITDCRSHGADGFHLEGEVEGESRVKLTVAWSDGERSRSVNDSTSSLATHLAALPLVVWTAADADTLTGAPALRRRLLDRGVLGIRPGALEAITRYRRCLSQKRRLLAQGGSGLASWNAVLARAAADLIGARSAYVERLSAALDRLLAELELPVGDVELRYRPSPASAAGSRRSASETAPVAGSGPGEEEILAALERLQRREREEGIPLAGPHRDDLVVRWRGRQLKQTASAGERKALGLALVAAHGRVLEAAGSDPIYLLDDADTELSAATLEQVWQLFSPARQLFASSNRPEVWSRLPISCRWQLAAGRLSEP